MGLLRESRSLRKLVGMVSGRTNEVGRMHHLIRVTNRVIPLFPLRPLYFVFTNIVATSDDLDLKTLQDIAKGLSKRIDTSHSVFQIHRLCVSLIDLYTRYADRVMYSLEAQPVTQAFPSVPGRTEVPQDHDTRQYRPMPPPFNFTSQLETELFEQFSLLPNTISSAEEQLNPLSPWDPAYFERQIDRDLLYMNHVSNIFQ